VAYFNSLLAGIASPQVERYSVSGFCWYMFWCCG